MPLKPHQVFRRNPERLPKRKAVTITLGFHTNDGVVLCADMQRTIGDMKTYDGKIGLTIFHQAGVIVSIAGAGHDDYIETAKSYILDGFSKPLSAPAVIEGIKSRLLSFFDTHLSRWSNFAPVIGQVSNYWSVSRVKKCIRPCSITKALPLQKFVPRRLVWVSYLPKTF